MHSKQVAAPDNTAVRTALWRALHVEVDSPPYVFEDEVGLILAAPDDGWRNRPDMSPFTRPFRASIVARARFVEDLVAEQAPVASGSTLSSERGSTLLPTVGRSLPLVYSCSRSISPVRRNGSASASSISALASRRSCGSCQSTSRQATRGGSDSQRQASTPRGLRSWRPPASACT